MASPQPVPNISFGRRGRFLGRIGSAVAACVSLMCAPVSTWSSGNGGERRAGRYRSAIQLRRTNAHQEPWFPPTKDNRWLGPGRQYRPPPVNRPCMHIAFAGCNTRTDLRNYRHSFRQPTFGACLRRHKLPNRPGRSRF